MFFEKFESSAVKSIEVDDNIVTIVFNSSDKEYKYNIIDEEFTNINMMIKYFKFGFGRTTDLVNEAIRNNEITREEGIKLVKRYDGVCDNSIIKKYCKYIGISNTEFWAHTNKWVNEKIFIKTSRRPIPRFTVGSDFND